MSDELSIINQYEVFFNVFIPHWSNNWFYFLPVDRFWIKDYHTSSKSLKWVKGSNHLRQSYFWTLQVIWQMELLLIWDLYSTIKGFFVTNWWHLYGCCCPLPQFVPCRCNWCPTKVGQKCHKFNLFLFSLFQSWLSFKPFLFSNWKFRDGL